MPELVVTLRNYRCFEDTKPASMTIGPGFTALVGPNNSGKSSLLRFFYELRGLFANLAPQPLVDMLNQRPQPAQLLDVYDPLEIFCDRNERDASFELAVELPHGSGRRAESITFSSGRDGLGWRASAPVSAAGSENPFSLNQSTVMFRGGTPIPAAAPVLEAAKTLANSMYVGPFRNALNEGAADYYELSIGSKFIQTWKDWKTGANKQQNRTIEKVTHDIAHIFDNERLEINAADQLKTLQVTIDGRPYKLRELGAGMSQFILVFSNAAIRRPKFVFIDEPELNLHPSLQIDFLTSLASYASEGIVFATHNLGLARATAERVYSLRRDESRRVVVAPFSQTAGYAEFVGEMSFGSYQALGFDRLLLVEGPHDVKTIQQFLRLVKKDHQVVVIPLGGAGLINARIEHELAELKRITPKISVLVDSERPSPTAPPIQDRLDFEAVCKRLGFDVHLTDRRATENYLTEAAGQKEKGGNYKGLGFHDLLKSAKLPWAKGDNWRIARHMTWADLEQTDVGAFLKAL